MEPHNQYRILTEAIRLLAAPFDTQMSLLPDFVNQVDEILIDYYDAYLLVPQLLESNMLSESVVIFLNDLSSTLDAIDEDESLCTLKALKKSAQWDEIRTLSHNILSQMNEPQTPINLSHIKWIKS